MAAQLTTHADLYRACVALIEKLGVRGSLHVHCYAYSTPNSEGSRYERHEFNAAYFPEDKSSHTSNDVRDRNPQEVYDSFRQAMVARYLAAQSAETPDPLLADANGHLIVTAIAPAVEIEPVSRECQQCGGRGFVAGDGFSEDTLTCGCCRGCGSVQTEAEVAHV